MEDSEGKLWRKVNPGGETKKALERGEAPFGEYQTADDLAHEFQEARNRMAATMSAERTPPSPEEIEFIGLVQMFLLEERRELGLEPGFYIPTERVRLFHPEVWESDPEPGGRKAGKGHYVHWADTVEVRLLPERGKFAHFANVAHEIRHQASYYEMDPRAGRAVGRVGYRSYEDGTGNGLNEALTEEPVHEWFERYKSVLCKKFGIDPRNYRETLGLSEATYDYYRTTVKAAAARVDGELYGDAAITWKNLKRGYHDGDPRGVEDIRRVWGEDAFRVFMAMGNHERFDLEKYIDDNKKKGYAPIASIARAEQLVNLNIQRYFTNEQHLTEERRKELLEELLSYVKEEAPIGNGTTEQK